MKIALIGAGYSGIRFLQCLEQIPKKRRVEIVGIVEIKHKLSSKLKKYRVYHTIQEMVDNEQPDTVIIATPDNTHELIFQELKKYNIPNIIAEKPLVSNLKSCLKLEKYLSSKKLTVNYVERMSPIVEKCKNLLQKKRIVERI